MHAVAIGLGAIAVTTTTCSGRARDDALAADHDLVVIPRGGEDRGQGEVIGLFLREEIPGGLSFVDTWRRSRSRAASSTFLIPSTACIDPRRGDASASPRRHRHLRGLQRPSPLRCVQRRGASVCAQVQPDDGAARRARAPGVGTGAVRMRAFEAREFLLSLRSAQVLRRPSRSCTSSPQMDGPGQGTGSVVPNLVQAVSTTDEIYEKYLQKRSSRSTTSPRGGPGGRGTRVPVVGSAIRSQT